MLYIKARNYVMKQRNNVFKRAGFFTLGATLTTIGLVTLPIPALPTSTLAIVGIPMMLSNSKNARLAMSWMREKIPLVNAGMNFLTHMTGHRSLSRFGFVDDFQSLIKMTDARYIQRYRHFKEVHRKLTGDTDQVCDNSQQNSLNLICSSKLDATTLSLKNVWKPGKNPLVLRSHFSNTGHPGHCENDTSGALAFALPANN